MIMKTVNILSDDEVKELKKLYELIMNINFTFADLTGFEKDEEDIEPDELAQSVEELKHYMQYDMSYLKKAEDVLHHIIDEHIITESETLRDYDCD